MDALDGLDALNWSGLLCAYGPADTVPDLLRRVLDEDATSRSAALEDLWGTVWHQGTVFECTPLVVPFLVNLATNPEGDDDTRAQVALLLTSVATATSFVLPHDQQMRRPAWLREPGETTPPRDLTVESQPAVAACVATLVHGATNAPPATRAGLVAVLAAVATDLPTTAVAALRPLDDDDDERLATAACLTRMLTEDGVTDDVLLRLAEVDVDAADYLASIGGWPVGVRAVELVRELAERVATEQAR